MKLIATINFLLILGLILPSFCLAQQETPQMPQTTEEAKSMAMKILGALPGAIKKVWQEQALPFLQSMWEWFKDFWNTYIGPKVEVWWQKFLNLLGKETPDLKEEFQKEKEEMQKDLWERFKDLIK